MRTRRIALALLVAGTLALAGCSDDGDDAGTDAAPAADAGDSGGDALTKAEGDAFVAALTAGTAEGPAYIECVAGEVKAAVDAGDVSPQEVRDWTDGKGFESDLQDFITSPDVVMGCYEAIAATTTAAG